VAGAVRSYRDLLVWQKGMDLAAEVYRLSRAWPKEEVYGLTSQARRAAAAIPANIAEGYGRESTASYSHFLKIARGSLKELETHLLLAERVGLTSQEHCADALKQADELGRMLGGLIRSVGRKGAEQ
jgi:four helix bundle protein